MKSAILFALFLLGWNVSAATLRTEFYAVPGTGGNTNSGSSIGANVYATQNGNWDATTDTFVPTDGSTPASSIAVGDWVSIYNDGATLAVYIVRVLSVAAGPNGAIVVVPLASTGTEPTTSATARSLVAGGAWAGMSGAVTFPTTLLSLRLTNSAYDRPRYNFKNNLEYNVSAALTVAGNGPYDIQGFTTTPGDGGRFAIAGNAAVAAFIPLTISGNLIAMRDFVVRSNGTSSTAGANLSLAGSNLIIENGVVSHGRGSGILITGTGVRIGYSEVFSNGVANTALDAGIRGSSPVQLSIERCFIHDNGGANIAGIFSNAGLIGDRNIIHRNGTNGITINTGTGQTIVRNNIIMANGGNGIELKGAAADNGSLFVENTAFFGNTLGAIASQIGNSNKVGTVRYILLGSGTQTNGSGMSLIGSTRTGAIDFQDSTFITYAADLTPWTAPTTGNFTVARGDAWNNGAQNFVQTQATYTNTLSWLDIGATQHLGVTNSTASTFAQ